SEYFLRTSRASSIDRIFVAENTPGPVERIRGPMNSPVSTMSSYESTSVVDVCGSRVVVTPYATLARYSNGCERCTPNAGHRCAWMSTYPGRIVFPLTSITRAPDGTVTFPCGPTATMR